MASPSKGYSAPLSEGGGPKVSKLSRCMSLCGSAGNSLGVEIAKALNGLMGKSYDPVVRAGQRYAGPENDGPSETAPSRAPATPKAPSM